MIVQIQGELLESSPLAAVIDVNGLGYEVHIPLTTAEKLPAPGANVRLHTLAVYREDGHNLYGFWTRDERDFFRLLVEKVSGIGPRIALNILSKLEKVSGIGPRIALNILSKLSVDTLKHAIASGDIVTLTKCPGIGKKTAERLVIELRDKVFPGGVTTVTAGGTPVVAFPNTPEQDAIAALVALGYKLPDADKAVKKASLSLGATASVETLIRASLGN